MAGDTDFQLDLPQGWRSSKLGEVADVTKLAGYEFTKHVKYDDTGEIIALRALNVTDGRLDLTSVKRIPKHVSDSLPRSKLHKNDILLTYTGSIGQVAVIDKQDRYHLAPNVCRLRVNGEANVGFVFSVLRSSIFKQQLSSFTVGSTQPTIPMKSIREIALPLPPLAEQKAIAAVLGALDDKIELNRRMAESTEEHLVPRSLLEASGVKYDYEHNMVVCCAGCNGLKGESLPPPTHTCWKSRKNFIKECSRFVAECRLKNFQKYKTHVENVLKKRAGQ